MKKINVKSCSLIIIAGLATACSGEYVNKEKENKVLEESKETTTFQSGIIPSARTSMEHIKGGKGKFFWEAEDILWVDISYPVHQAVLQKKQREPNSFLQVPDLLPKATLSIIRGKTAQKEMK